jgi:predicted dehydrogenase
MTATRREFLKTSAVLGGAALLSATVYAAETNVIKVGLVGAGGRGSGAASDCLDADPAVKLVAIGDAFADRANDAARRLQGEYKDRVDVQDRVFVGLDAYERVIANCDLVILATPPGFRPMMIEAAVNAGKNVFTEKPVAVDGAGVRRVLAAYEQAQKKNLKCVAGTQRRHENSYLESMKRIHDGDMGDIVAGRCYWNQGGLWHRKRDQQMSDLEWQIRNWLYFVWLSGDHICEQHIHNLDVINWALRGHPISAVGLGGRQVRTGPEYGHIFDHHALDLVYPNDVHVLSMCRQIDKCANDVSEAVVGTKGSWNSHAQAIKGEKAWRFDRKNGNAPYKQEHKDLIQAIKEGKSLNELKNVAESTLTAIMGRLATYTGKSVSWEQALATNSTMPEKLSWQMTLPVPAVAMPGQTELG